MNEFLNSKHTNTFCINGYDSDSFMLKLNEELGLKQPQILDKPFSCLKDMLNEINDINEEEHFKGVKERLEIAKKNVHKSINQFEEGKVEKISVSEQQNDALKKEIIEILISEDFDELKVNEIEKKVISSNEIVLDDLLSGLYYNWGTSLGSLAESKEGQESEELYKEAFSKYAKAIEIKPDKHEAYSNWGSFLGHLAESKEGQESEELYKEAFSKYAKAVEIKPDLHEAYYNWGNSLGNLAKSKEGQESEELYEEAFEKLNKCVELGGSPYNLACLYAVKGDKVNALKYLETTIKSDQIKVEFVEKDDDWKEFLEDKDFIELLDKYRNRS